VKSEGKEQNFYVVATWYMHAYTVSEFSSGDWYGLDKLENRLCRNIHAPKQASKGSKTTTPSAIHPFAINKFIPVSTFI